MRVISVVWPCVKYLEAYFSNKNLLSVLGAGIFYLCYLWRGYGLPWRGWVSWAGGPQCCRIHEELQTVTCCRQVSYGTRKEGCVMRRFSKRLRNSYVVAALASQKMIRDHRRWRPTVYWTPVTCNAGENQQGISPCAKTEGLQYRIMCFKCMSRGRVTRTKWENSRKGKKKQGKTRERRPVLRVDAKQKWRSF